MPATALGRKPIATTSIGLRCRSRSGSRFALHHPHDLDRASLDEAARLFQGEHDFTAFRASSCNAKTTTRHVFVSHWLDHDTELVFEVAATGFLQHMIRNMVGTLLEIGRGKRPVESITHLFARGDRTQAGPTAPAKGLHLIRGRLPLTGCPGCPR